MEEADVRLGEAVPSDVPLPPQDLLAPVQGGEELVKGCRAGASGSGAQA